jgi:tetratricopeptide (TPR) repeat protein
MLTINFFENINYKKAYFLIGFFSVCFFSNFHAQNQKKSDSLKKDFRKNNYNRKNKLEILKNIAQNETNADEILIFGKELIQSSIELDSLNFLYTGYLQVGNAYRLKSDLTHALDHYLKASKVAEDIKRIDYQAEIKIAIADAYSIMGDSKNAVSKYKQGINLMFKADSLVDKISLASAHLNLGDEYYNQKKLDSALYYFSESGRLFEEADFELGKAYNLGNVGLVYAEKNQDKEAEENLNEAIKVLEKYEDYNPITEYLGIMSDIYIKKGNKVEALKYLNKSISIAENYGFKDKISDGYFKLSKFYEKSGNYKKSFKLYKDYIIYRDSVNNIDKVQKMAYASKDYEVNLANEKAKFEIDKAEKEKELLNQQKKTQIIINIGIGIVLVLIGFLAYFLFKRNKLVVETSKVIEQEKERSDQLLKNILPEETAKELKEKGSVEAKRFDSVSVLFSDFKGFTKFSKTLSPEELVKTIVFYFSKFD